jgi:hypothetical protein
LEPSAGSATKKYSSLRSKVKPGSKESSPAEKIFPAFLSPVAPWVDEKNG